MLQIGQIGEHVAHLVLLTDSLIYFILISQMLTLARNKDPTVLEVVNSLMDSPQWQLIDRKVRAQKENTRQAMRLFFETNFFFSKYFYVYKKQKYLRGWRKRQEVEEADYEKDLSDEDEFEEDEIF